jgi:hypothetical protein
MGDTGNEYRTLVENLNGKNHSGDPVIDGRLYRN